MAHPQPQYRQLAASGKLNELVELALGALQSCCLCPRRCGVNRLDGETGFCQTGHQARVCSFNAHYGEEAPLVGRHGSGTIFFSHCNLLCNFCQNYAISHGGEGNLVTPERLAEMMLALQQQGCHNINFVTPSHVIPQILEALAVAVARGLHVPLVYNSGGYDSVETLQLLEGVFDIYMPDFKFWHAEIAASTCQAPDYPVVARAAITEMHRQVGDLVLNTDGIAARGLLVRHLVMPENSAGTAEIAQFLASQISPNTYTNIMSQYRPCGTAHQTPPLHRRLAQQEHNTALKAAQAAGLLRLDGARRFFFFGFDS